MNKVKNMRKISFISSLFLLVACANPEKDKSCTDDIISASATTPPSESFKAAVKEGVYADQVAIKDEFVLFDDDTVYYPSILSIDKSYPFKGHFLDETYQLTLKRTTATSIEYHFQSIKGTRVLKSYKGIAELNPTFYLASEMDEDDQDQEGYGSDEYIHKKGENGINIRIGSSLNKQQKRRVLFYLWNKKGIDTSIKPITLREE